MTIWTAVEQGNQKLSAVTHWAITDYVAVSVKGGLVRLKTMKREVKENETDIDRDRKEMLS